MEIQYTTEEQARRLMELGLDPNTADMLYCNASIRGGNYTDEFSVNVTPYKEHLEWVEKNKEVWSPWWQVIPCWSVGALIKLLPKRINLKESGKEAKLYMDGTMCCYKYYDMDEDMMMGDFQCYGKTFILCVISLMEMMLMEGYIEKASKEETPANEEPKSVKYRSIDDFVVAPKRIVSPDPFGLDRIKCMYGCPESEFHIIQEAEEELKKN